MKKLRIEHRTSGDIRIVTEAQWESIKANGFEPDFKILPDNEPPSEVKNKLSEKQGPESTAIETDKSK